jgi:methylthioribose-1-phosphate isomerase
MIQLRIRSLATTITGTALGIIRSLHSKAVLSRAFYTETRPYNQGSRLTGYELHFEGIQGTLIPDSAAATLLTYGRRSGSSIGGKQEGEVERPIAVIVGADRVVANGDTANKIGTFQLALAAKFAGVLFVVAAPRSSIDTETKSGEGIVIEERKGEEMIRVSGILVDAEATSFRTEPSNPNAGLPERTPMAFMASESISTGVLPPKRSVMQAPYFQPEEPEVKTIRSATILTAAVGPTLDVYNPSFDVTPAELIDAIVTEVGVVTKKPGASSFDFTAIMSAK